MWRCWLQQLTTVVVFVYLQKKTNEIMECPICSGKFSLDELDNHVDMCVFGDSAGASTSSNKRIFPFPRGERSEYKRPRVDKFEGKDQQFQRPRQQKTASDYGERKGGNLFGNWRDGAKKERREKDHVPLAERLRPVELSDYVGQKHMIGGSTVLGQLLEKNEVTSMILWGPPGCGKTSLANVIAKMSNDKTKTNSRFIRLSATSSGIADIREAVATAIAESKNSRRTIVFMDEIHRFNKLQQDIFLPHVEAGTFVLIGATTENPSFSLNSALLSRCRVVPMQKLNEDDIRIILNKGVKSLKGRIVENEDADESEAEFVIARGVLDWLSSVCNGDARVALNGLELTVKSKLSESAKKAEVAKLPKISLEDVKSSLERACSLSEKKTDQNQDFVAAMHKCIRDSHSNGALYWLARLMAAGEDPVYIGKRLIRIASEDVGLSDPVALDTAVHTMHGCQMIGMPECDVLLAQCVCYLCKATKSKDVNVALRRVQKVIDEHKGAQPSVPVFIRDVSSQKKLAKAVGNNLIRLEDNSRNHLPAGLETRNFFEDDETSLN